LCCNEPELLDLLDQAMQNPEGANQYSEGFDNIQSQPAPTGTSSAAAFAVSARIASAATGDLL
jgi:hypothetical protein